MKIGLIRERKNPPDRRVAFLPAQCALISELYPQIHIVVEPSEDRCVQDEAYVKQGIEVSSDISDCQVLFGIKEVPPAELLQGKTYFMFSHTIKKQAHNRVLLQQILQKKITLVDYECLTDEFSNRTVAFGRFAGIVGAYNALRMWFFRNLNIELKPAYKCLDMAEMLDCARRELHQLAPIKIAITGSGRVGQGAIEVLRNLGIKEVEPSEYQNFEFTEPVFTVVRSRHYVRKKSDGSWNELHFRKNPGEYQSDFSPFFKSTDLLIACAFWDPQAPVLFTREEAARDDFRIRLISDVTCDLDGSIPTTLRTSSIMEPFYDVDLKSFKEHDAFSDKNFLTVCAVDNLPTELPFDASKSFGEMLIKHVIPELVSESQSAIDRATLARNGHLMPNYSYLEEYVLEKV